MKIENVTASAYTIPTETPESDGTLAWNKTTLVVVEARSIGVTGLGYTYANKATARVVHELLAEVVQGRDAMNLPEAWAAMWRVVRNFGQTGIAAMAIAAVDAALWDLKARLLDVSILRLLGAARSSIPVYGSGGFTSYSNEQLQDQFGSWAEQGITKFKMKVGREPARDPERIRAAREAIGIESELYVDANGAFTRKFALAQAELYSQFLITWFEEPVPSADLEGLNLLRNLAPAGMDIAAGEYGYNLGYFCDMLAAQAVDVLQADATRCGITGFLQTAALAEANFIPLSSHTAPSLHAPLCCAVTAARDVEYFFDHVRIEQLFFDGAAKVVNGKLTPDLTKPGFGLELKRRDAERYAA